MALPFDPTIGGAAATSYVVLSDARDYFTSIRPASSALADSAQVSDASLQTLLMQATQRLDILRWLGTTVTTTQRLQHPRQWMKDRNGVWIPDNIIVRDVIYATCEVVAVYYAASLKSKDVRAASALQQFKEVTVDVISLVPADPSIAPAPDEIPLAAMRYISHLLASSGMTGRVERA